MPLKRKSKDNISTPKDCRLGVEFGLVIGLSGSYSSSRLTAWEERPTTISSLKVDYAKAWKSVKRQIERQLPDAIRAARLALKNSNDDEDM